ncbi:DUF309 domain-containing protein [Halovivax gelatinilyticus]|uniref:DUF309 domain-containing protein n=1 Tax=Halovivax gelatinilyticus TaxID=2961597 RepID=UPI0020CA3874|nr:DUF309 domain-containing protein [Halovivax gelatinilyticus]
MRTALRVGIAIYNDGHYHAAHDAWEGHWLDLESGTPEERLLHGLIQFTAAVYHACDRNWEGAVGLATSAGEYLDGIDAEYRGCNVDEVGRYLRALATDPEGIERGQPLALTHEGERLTLADLTPEETVVAANVLAEEWDYDEELFERAGDAALEALDEGDEGTPFLALLFDFVRGDESDRAVIYQRLEALVDRRESRRRDVEGLFDEN